MEHAQESRPMLASFSRHQQASDMVFDFQRIATPFSAFAFSPRHAIHFSLPLYFITLLCFSPFIFSPFSFLR